jgi:hypothetical protein
MSIAKMIAETRQSTVSHNHEPKILAREGFEPSSTDASEPKSDALTTRPPGLHNIVDNWRHSEYLMSTTVLYMFAICTVNEKRPQSPSGSRSLHKAVK